MSVVKTKKQPSSILEMSSSTHAPNYARGFTLLEIIVVTLIIGLTAAMIGLNFNRDIDKVAYNEARRFRALLEELREQSVISAKTLGVEINESDSSYQFLKSTKENKWTKLGDDELFRRREIPGYLSMNLELDVKPSGVKNVDPIVVTDPMGEISPFSFNITAERNIYQVTLDNGQNLEVRTIDKSSVK